MRWAASLKPSELREHRTPLFRSPSHRWLSGCLGFCHTVSGRPNAHTQPSPTPEHARQRTRPSNAPAGDHERGLSPTPCDGFEYQARIKAYQLAASMHYPHLKSSISQRNQRTFKRSTASTKRPRKLLENNCSWHVGWPNGVFNLSFKSAMQEEATEAGMPMET